MMLSIDPLLLYGTPLPAVNAAMSLASDSLDEPNSKVATSSSMAKPGPLAASSNSTPTWLTEVDRTEVEPVDHRSHRRVDPGDMIPPLPMHLFVWSTESHMVNAAYLDEAVEKQFRMNLQMHLCTRPTRANLKNGHGVLVRSS